MGLFSRRRQPLAVTASARTFTVASPRRGNWSLASSAYKVDPSDKREAKVQRMLRQGWQSDAWNYRDSIGELRYAGEFLANCTARMRIFPAIYPLGGESDDPVALDKAPGIPAVIQEQLVSVCAQAMLDLGNGREAISGLLHKVSSNKTVTGEWYLLGRTDDQSGDVEWSCRSVDELVVYDEVWSLREIPDDRQNGVIPWIPLDPVETVISRVWTPHPRFALYADGPLKAILGELESLSILRRGIRATGRSRLAANGLLFIPEEMSIKAPVDDNDDPQADPFLDAFTTAMMEPIADEGVASAVVPIVIRGPGDQGKNILHIDFTRKFDEQAATERSELLGVLATSIDLPKEIIVGMADLNHWTAWQVDDSTYKYHVKPHVTACCDDLSAAYLRPYADAAGIPAAWVQRLVFGADPTELIEAPDRGAAAEKAYTSMAISGEAYRKANGWTEDDAPSMQELEMRRVMDIRALPLNLLMEYASRADPSLVVPAMTGPPQLPGIKPGGGVDVGQPPAALGPGAPPTVPAPPPASPPPGPAAPGPPAASRPTPAPVTASGSPSQSTRLSRKLVAIDSDLRARLQTAANAAMLRALERAGAKLRTKVAKDETLRTRIAQRANERVPSILGPDVVTAAGLSPAELIGNDWSGLHAQFMEWTESGQAQALATALRIGNLDADSAAAVKAQAAMAAGRDAAWELLSESLTQLAHRLLYDPDPNAAAAAETADLSTATLVPAGTIRGVLAVAGGTPASSVAVATDGTVALTGFVGQVATGPTLGDLLADHGVMREGYEWVHGPSLKVFEPHAALDGAQFENFDDPRLANDDGWPDNQSFFPGDHDGSLVAGTIVEGSVPRAVSLRWYEGEIVKLTTTSGQFLAVTPNHPVLTDRGWIGAGDLREGDHVVRCLDAQGAARLVPDDHHVPARVEDLFATRWISPDMSARAVPIATEDFHGDGEAGQVAVVAANGHLGSHREATLGEPLGHQPLAAVHVADGLTRASRPFQGLVAVRPAALGIEGEGSETTTLLGGSIGREEQLRIGTSSWRDADPPESLGDRIAIHAEALGESLDALAGFVELDELVEVDHCSGFAGHVFDLHTREHWYVAGGIIAHNCLCDFMPIYLSPTEE